MNNVIPQGTTRFALAKITVQAEELREKLRAISKVLPTNPLVSILENIRLDYKDGLMIITGYDLYNLVRAKVKADGKGACSVCVPAEIFIDTLNLLPDQPVTLNVYKIEQPSHTRYFMEMASCVGDYKIACQPIVHPTMPSLCWPKTRPITEKINSTITIKDLKMLTQNAPIACAKGDLNEAFRGANTSFLETGLSFLATDGVGMIYSQGQKNNAIHNCVIAKKSLTRLKSIVSTLDDDTQVEVYKSEVDIKFVFQDYSFTCMVIKQEFPNTDAITSIELSNIAKVKTSDLLAAMNIASNFSDPMLRFAKINVNEDELLIAASTELLKNKTEVKVPAEITGLTGCHFFVSIGHMKSFLSNIEGDFMSLSYNDIGTMMSLQDLNNKDIKLMIAGMVQMPQRIEANKISIKGQEEIA